MNVFATDTDPMVAATHLSDQHVRSQLGETARILTTALHTKGLAEGPLFGKPYNPGGRFAQWAGESWDNFFWLVYYGMALVEEHDFRFGTVHKSSSEILACGQMGRLMVIQTRADLQTPSEWPRCEAAKGFEGDDTHKAYRKVLQDKYAKWGKRGKVPTWTRCDPPFWLNA